MINPQKAVEWYKQRYSSLGRSDYDIYESLKKMYPNMDYAENPFTTQAPKEQSTPTEEELDKKANPGFFKKLLTANLSDKWAEDGNWWAEAYNKSIAGTLYQMMHGEAKYQVDDIEREWYDEAGQFFVGLISPIDVLTFFGSSGVGSVASKTLATGPLRNYMTKGLSKMIGQKTFEDVAKTKFGRYLASSAAIDSGFSLGTYGAAGAALQDQAQQSLEITDGTREERDYLQTTWSAVKHGTTSAFLGAGAGFITKGIMSPKFARTKIKNDPLFANKVTRLTMNPAGQVAAEGAVFGTGQIAERALMGEELDMDDWLSSIFMNTAIVGGLRASMKPLRMAESDFTRYQKAKKDFFQGVRDPKTGKYTGGVFSDINNKKVQSRVAKEIETINETVKTLEEQGIPAPKELIERLSTLEVEADNMMLGLDAFGKNLKNYNKILKKMEELPNMTPEEQVKLRAQILKDTGAINLSLYHFYSEMKLDKDFAYQVYKDYFGKEPLTKKQKKEIDLMIDQKVKDMEDVNFMINQGALNNPEALKMAQERYLTGFDVSAKPIKNKKGEITGYETQLRTPDGSKISLAEAIRTKKTEAEALKFGEELRETYIKGLKGEDLETARAIKTDVEVVRYTPIKDGKAETITRPKKGEEAIGGTETIPVIKEGTKAEVDKMVQEGRAKIVEPTKETPIVDISDPSKKAPVSRSEEMLEYLFIKEQEKEVMKDTTLDVQTGDIVKKKADYDNIIINKPENQLSTVEKNLRSLITTGSGETVKSSKIKGKDTKKLSISAYITNFKQANNIEKLIMFDILDVVVKNNTPKTAKNRLSTINNIIKYLKTKKKTLDKFEENDVIEFYNWMDANKFKLNSDSNSGIAVFLNILNSKDWIKNSTYERMYSYVQDKFTYINETAPGKTKPAKEGIRRTVIEKGRKKSIITGDEGYELGAYVAAVSGVRLPEMANIKSNLIQKDGKGRWYIEMPVIDISEGAGGTKIAKFKTYTHQKFIPSESIAERLKTYLEQGGNLATGKDGKQNITKYISSTINSDNKIKFYDLRKRIETKASKFWIKENLKDDVKFMLGHDKTRIERFYVKDRIEDIIDAQVRIHELLGTKDISKGDKDFRIVSKGEIPAPKEIHLARKASLMKRYSEVAVELVKEFKDKNIPDDAVGYLEKVDTWAIKVKLGKAPSDVIPHEISHYVFKLLDAVERVQSATGTKLGGTAAKTMKLYKQAQKLFVDKNGKFSEESAVLMIGKAIDKQLDSPMMAKATGFFKRFNMWLKSVFNKPLSKEEVAYALGTKIIKRKGIPTTDITGMKIAREFRTVKDFKSGKAFANAINRDLRIAKQKFGTNYEELKTFIAREAGIENPKQFKIGVPQDNLSVKYDTKIQELQSFYNTFESLNLKEFIGKKDALKKLNLVTKIEKTRVFEKGITSKEQKELLQKVFLVEDGNLYKASYEKLKSYNDYLIQRKNVQRDNVDWLSKDAINTIANLSNDSKMKRLIKEGVLIGGEVHEALGYLGAKKLQRDMLSHYNLEESNAAVLLKFNEASLNIIGGNMLTREGKLNKIKDNMVIALDNNGEMLLGLQRAKEIYGNKLPIGEKKIISDAQKYFDKAIKPEWKQTIKTNKDGYAVGDGLGKKNKDGSYKYLNMETKEGQIAASYIENIMNGLGKDKFESALRQSTNKAEFERLSSSSGIKFIEDGIYMTRALTSKAKNILGVEGKQRERFINKLTIDIASDRAKKKHGKNYTKEQRIEEMEYARVLAENQFNDMVHFNASKISIKNLKKRYSLQELYVENEKGKLIRTYEHKFDRTVTPYVHGMSKFYATLEMFPETIQNMKPGNGIHKIFKKAEKQLQGASSKELSWIKDVVKKQLGVERSQDPYEIVFRTTEALARTVAKAGLSFPTAGVKNLLTGTTQTLFAHRFRDVVGGFALVLAKDADVYNRALNSNAFRVGNVIYEGRNIADKFLDATAFKAGFMKPTEKFNRLLAIAAAKADMQRQLKRLQTYSKGDKLYERAKDRLNSFYFLTDKEINTIQKYPTVKAVKGDIALPNYDKIQLMRDVNNINNKMNTYAHVNTQGSSADLFMPKLWGKEGIRPLTLFKRMAFAATANTIRNSKYSFRQLKKGQRSAIIRPVMGLTATYLSGSAMIGIYSSLLGTQIPKENSDWWRRFWTTMWKGEFLGLASELASPLDSDLVDSLNPAIFRTLGSTFMELGQLIHGESNFRQFGDGLMRSNFSLYSNALKVVERRYNPLKNVGIWEGIDEDLNRDRIRISSLYRDYMKEKGIAPPKDMQRNELSPYYEDFKTYFYLGTEEEFAKHFYTTFFAVAHDRYRYGDSIEDSFKQAKSMMKSKVKALNPNKGSLFKSNKEGKKNSLDFIKWLQHHKDADKLTLSLFEAEAKYKERLKKYMSTLDYYAKKLNVSSYYDYFDWVREERF